MALIITGMLTASLESHGQMLYPEPPAPIREPYAQRVEPQNGIIAGCVLLGAAALAGTGLYYLWKRCSKKKPRVIPGLNDEGSTNEVAQAMIRLQEGSGQSDLFVTGPIDSCGCSGPALSDIEPDSDEPQLIITTVSGNGESGLFVNITDVKAVEWIDEETDDRIRKSRGWPFSTSGAEYYVGSRKVPAWESPLRIYGNRIVALDGPGFEDLERVVIRVQASETLDEFANWQSVATIVSPVGMTWNTVVPPVSPGSPHVFYRVEYEPAPY